MADGGVGLSKAQGQYYEQSEERLWKSRADFVGEFW